MVQPRSASMETMPATTANGKHGTRVSQGSPLGKANGPVDGPYDKDSKKALEDSLKAKSPENGNDASAKAGSKQASDKNERQKEDEIVNKGKEIAQTRSLLCQAFSRPAPEPAYPKSHWSFLLDEMSWLASDFSQERLWKKSTALAISYEIAKMKGDFKLKTPPLDPGWKDPLDPKGKVNSEHWQKYSKEIAELRKSAMRGRQSARAKAAILALDSSTDPVFADIEAHLENGLFPGTPPLEEISLQTTLAIDDFDDFAEAVQERLMKTDLERFINEEIANRSYRLEYEAALASHQLAVAEQHRDDNMITGLFGDFPGYVSPEPSLTGKKPGRRKKTEKANATPGVGDLEDEYKGASRTAAKSSMVEDVYLKKKKPTRLKQSYPSDMDMDYEAVPSVASGAATRTTRLQRRKQREEHARQGKEQGNYQQQQQQRSARATVPGGTSWTKAEDDLLLAVVHEFGINWQLVSEVLNLSLLLLGIYRPGVQCRQRFRQLCVNQESQGVDSDERAYQVLLSRMGKQSARELLARSLPVRDDALIRLMEALAQVGSSARTRRTQEEARNEHLRTQQQVPHASYTAIVGKLLTQNGGKRRNPLELAATVNTAYVQQAKQQQMLAAQVAAQHNQTYMNGVNAGNPPAMPVSNQPVPLGAAPGADPNAAVPRTMAQLQASISHLQNILQTGQVNGREMTDEMRKALELQRATYLTQLQQHQAAIGTTASAPGATPNPTMGGNPSASFATMQAQAQQQVAAAALNGRSPVLAPGVFGVNGSPNSQMGLGVPAAGMTLPSGGNMGPSLPAAAQQQLVMQQMMAQQQAATIQQQQQQQQ